MALKILLADDSMTAQNMGKKILTEGGYEVVAVSNGAAAVKRIASEKPDLAILDVYMPGYTGLEVCEKIKQAPETAKIPVLLTVGKMEAFKPEDGNRVKADGLMIKPFEATDLLAVVQKFEQKLTAPAQADQTVRLEHPPDLTVHPSHDELMPDEEEEAPPPKPMAVPAEMSAAPAMMDMEEHHGGPLEFAVAAPPLSEVPTYSIPDYGSPAEVAPSAPELDLAPVHAAEPLAPAHEAAPDLAPPIVHPAAEMPGHGELELTPEPTGADVHIAQDPALVTDLNDIATQFVTKFGVENPEVVPVGYAPEEVAEVDAAGQVEPADAPQAAFEITPPVFTSAETDAEAVAAHVDIPEVAATVEEHAVAEVVAASAVVETPAHEELEHTQRIEVPVETAVEAPVHEAIATAPPVHEELEHTQRIEVYHTEPIASVEEHAAAVELEPPVEMPRIEEVHAPEPKIELHEVIASTEEVAQIVTAPAAEPAASEPARAPYPRTERIETYRRPGAEETQPEPAQVAASHPAEPEPPPVVVSEPPIPQHEASMSMVASMPEPVGVSAEEKTEPVAAQPAEPEPATPPHAAEPVVEPAIPPVEQRIHVSIGPDTYGAHEIPEPVHAPEPEQEPVHEPSLVAAVAPHEDHLVQAFVAELAGAPIASPEHHETDGHGAAAHIVEAASAAAAAAVPAAMSSLTAHPAAPARIDVDAVANAVDKVLEDLKPELIARIIREMRH